MPHTNPAHVMNGHPWLWRIVAGVQLVTLGWMGWVSLELIEAGKERAVMGTRVVQIDRQVGTISGDYIQTRIDRMEQRIRALEVAGSDRGGDP